MHISIKSLSFAVLLLATALPAAAQNLISNPGFEQGNTGFSTDYRIMGPNSPLQYGNQITAPGQVAIGNDPHIYGTGWLSSIRPHDGQDMLIVDGAYDSSMHAWISNPIAVQPHRTYDFSVYVTSLSPENMPELAFTINGQPLAPDFVPSGTVGEWNRFHVVWKSGTTTAIVIALADDETEGLGNDFALDDLSFVEQPWFYYVENWSGNAWNDTTCWISPGGIFTFGLAVFGIGLAILGIGLAVLGIQLASLLAGED